MGSKNIAGSVVGGSDGVKGHVSSIRRTRPVDHVILAIDADVESSDLSFWEGPFSSPGKKHTLAVDKIDLAVESFLAYTGHLTNPAKGHFVHEKTENDKVLVRHSLSICGRSNREGHFADSASEPLVPRPRPAEQLETLLRPPRIH